jgi:excinuclease UvrABC nuclease subunit
MEESKKVKKLVKKLEKAEILAFPEEGKIELPEVEGVYAIVNKKDEVIHVGKTEGGLGGLFARLNGHLYGKSALRKAYLAPNEINLRNKCGVKWVEVKTERLRYLVEARAIGKLCPAYLPLYQLPKLQIEEKLE